MSVVTRHAFAVALLAGAVGVRVADARGTLLYPDGYQYLLMARGIGAHLRPVIELGHGGDLFIPSADAAEKPLYPAAIALFHLLGLSWRNAATAVSAISAGMAVGLAGILAARLTGSRIAGGVAALLLLVSPATRQWSSYAVPDPLAQALALGALLSVVDRRFRLGGVLAGLALFARPEFGLLLLVGAAAFTVRGNARAQALRFGTAGAAAAAVVLVVLRPPLDLAPRGWYILIGVAAPVVVGAALRAPSSVATGAGVVALVVAGWISPAVSSLATGIELPLVLFAVAGLAIAAPELRARMLVAAGALALLYAWKNPESARYAANLLPFAAVASGFAVAAIPRRRLILVAATATACLGAFSAAGPVPAEDSFTTVAGELPFTGTPLVTAAADAYGFLLYPRPVRWLRPGVSGAVLVDGAARAYEPAKRVHGRVLARLDAGAGFVRPDGRLDRRPALLFVP
jgi:hypothetical protein